MNFFSNILSSIGNFAASVGTQGCWFVFMDEPEMPTSLIEK